MADKTTTSNDNLHGDQFEAELPLPIFDHEPKKSEPAEVPTTSGDATVDLIRKKIATTYEEEPELLDEEHAIEKLVETSHLSKHQKFLEELARSSNQLPDKQAAWHEYYAGLSDNDKQQVWQEFYATHKEMSSYKQEQASHDSSKDQIHPTAFKFKGRRVSKVNKALVNVHKQTKKTLGEAKQFTPRKGANSLGFGLAVGSIVVLVFLFGFFNDRFIAPLIQPGRVSSSIPIITGAKIDKSPELLIPKINLAVPVVYGMSSIDPNQVQSALNDGVLHYADTAQPGQNGNLVIIGHSSNNIFNPGRYKYPFVLLHKLTIGDTFYIQKNGKRYVYVIYKRQIVSPDNVSVLGLSDRPATATLITCDPPGTSINRLVLVGEQISPAVNTNQPVSSQNLIAVASAAIPSN